jgi:tRNA threonylcarbamoyladenosine biosynthesis protein TsaE
MREAGVVAVEWGDRIEEILPAERITLTLDYEGEQGRRLEFRARGRSHEALLTSLPEEEKGIEGA